MLKFMKVRKAHDPEGKGKAFGAPWGDWLNLQAPTPPAYVELAYFNKTSGMMAEMAAAQGLEKEASMYLQWGETMRANFRKQHLQSDGSIKPGSQTAYVLALDCGLITDPDERANAGRHLAKLIQGKATAINTGMTTGFLGTKPLLPVLAKTGNPDLAISLLQSRRYPSWGYEVANGATTIWERWNSYTKEHGFGGENGKLNAAMNSFSHYAFGVVTEWMFTDLAGIAPAEPGYKTILLRPQFPSKAIEGVREPISWVKASHMSPHGRIDVHWKRRNDDALIYRASIPPNTKAKLILPESSPWTSGPKTLITRELDPGDHQLIIP